MLTSGKVLPMGYLVVDANKHSLADLDTNAMSM